MTYTIFGATGKVGRATVRALRDRGQPVRAVVRDERRGRELVEWGCGLAVADVRDPATIARAVDGADAVQVVCPIVPTAPDAPAELRGVVDAFAEALRPRRRRRSLRSPTTAPSSIRARASP